ncbi:MAG: hypothetical protein ABSB38_04680 [Dehalococcoidia bacterium]|jgi:hypothetical protein
MKKGKSTEKLFLEYLDRLLAGEQITVGDELSDEARAALELARKMLAFREEPSAAFRADLRDRLLRQVAEKQAATYPLTEREGFWDRVANLFPQRAVMIAVTSTALVVLLAFIGVVWYSSRFAGAPQQALAPSVAKYSVRLPANIVPEGITFEATTPLTTNPGQAAVYRVNSSQVTVASVTELGRRLGFTGQASLSHDGTKIVMTQGSDEEARQLTVWTASGAVEYGYVEPEKLYPSQPAQLPSQSEAELIAYDFLQQADLLPSGYRSPAQIKDETTVVAGGGYSVSPKYAAEAPPAAAPAAPSASSGPAEPTTPAPTTPTAPQAPTYWLVDLPYQVDGASATGPGSKIEVSVGDKGEVVKLVWSWRQMSPLGTDNIISQQQAYEDLIQGKGSLDVPLDCRKVVVEQVQLKYWLDPPSEKQDYALPVYEFTGTCLDKNGKTLEDFTGWTPALSSN